MAAGIISVQEQRETMADIEQGGLEYIGACPSHLSEAWIDIPLPDGSTNRTKVVWPKSSPVSGSSCSLIVYFHGGGFSTCSPDLVLAPARGFASVFPTMVACPSLNQMPEQGYTATSRNAWEVCAWLSNPSNLNSSLLKEEEIQVDLARGFVIGGLSAGATAAAVIAGVSAATQAGAADLGGISGLQSSITGVFSGLPFLVTESTVPACYRDTLKSREEHSDPDDYNNAMVRDLEHRIGDALNTPWFSPLNLNLDLSKISEHHAPKVYTYAGKSDIFRDDAVIYHKWLSQLEDVEARVVVIEDEGHTAWVSPPWPASHTQKIKEMTVDGMAWLLGSEWDRNFGALPA